MKKHPNSNLKQKLIKFIALSMGICYLANPLHEQIATVFHEISHFVEAPNSPISHHSHNNAHEHLAHHDGPHNLIASHHEHALLDLFVSFFDATDEPHPNEDTLITFFGYDKHINARQHSLPTIFLSYISHETLGKRLKTNIGHLAILDQPPQRNLPF